MAQLREPMYEELQKTVRVLKERIDIDEHLIDDLQSQGAVERSKVENLRQALVTSRRIGAAIGILMNRHRITEGQAFDLLQKASNRLNRKLRDVANDVVLTGRVPRA